MKISCILWIGLILFPFFSGDISAQQISANVATSYCDLIRNPELYDGKEVTVRAVYRYGYHWQELYCLKCRTIGKTWLAIDDDEITSESKKIFKKLPKDDGTVKALFRGVFKSSSRSFGDGSYRFKFELLEISDAELLTRSGADPEQFTGPQECQKCNYWLGKVDRKLSCPDAILEPTSDQETLALMKCLIKNKGR